MMDKFKSCNFIIDSDKLYCFRRGGLITQEKMIEALSLSGRNDVAQELQAMRF